jgi:thiol-disulfide isomerase/thioredoxin
MKSALLYTALCLVANAGLAEDAPLDALLTGDMAKLVVHAEPVAVPDTPFTTEEGGEMTLAAYAGEVTVVNFWAVWCAPCKAEMPSLGALQDGLGAGDDLEVVTIAMGRHNPMAIDRFFTEVAVDNLPRHVDPKQTLAREMGVLGLPVTVILNRNGDEVARLTGEADWNSAETQAVLQALAAE